MFLLGLEWSIIAGCRSSISVYHDPIDGFSVGKHPHVCSLLKGIFNKRAPVPKYKFMWNVQKGLIYLSFVGMPEHLNDKMLTLKTTLFIALTSSTRAHKICSLNIDFLMKLPTHYTFHFSKITKSTVQGKLRPPAVLTQFSAKNLCVRII